MQTMSLKGRDYFHPSNGNMPADPFCNPVKGKFEERKERRRLVEEPEAHVVV